MKQFKKSKYTIVGFSIILFILGGCGITPTLNSSATNQVVGTTQNSQQSLGIGFSPEKDNESSTNRTNNTQNTQINPLFQTTLTLPNGKVIYPNQSVRWRDLLVQLIVTSLTPLSKGGYGSVIGNHSTIVSHEHVSSSAGNALLVLNKRTRPAASHSNAVTYEYWAIVNGSQYTYAVEGTVIGNVNSARNEFSQFLSHWKVPKS